MQQNSDLTTANWTTVTNVPVMVGNQNQVTISPATGRNFYRLALASATAPQLSISPAGAGSVLISWPAPSTGYSLQQNASLATTNWVAVTNVPVVVGNQNQVTLSSGTGMEFFRLIQ